MRMNPLYVCTDTFCLVADSQPVIDTPLAVKILLSPGLAMVSFGFVVTSSP